MPHYVDLFDRVENCWKLGRKPYETRKAAIIAQMLMSYACPELQTKIVEEGEERNHDA